MGILKDTTINGDLSVTGEIVAGVETPIVSTETLSVDESIEFNGTKVNGAIYGLWETESIPANSDLNDYVTPGVYGIESNANAKTISNMPMQVNYLAGKLVVYASVGAKGLLSSGAWKYITQEYIPLQANNPVFRRVINTNGDNDIIYDSWYPASGIDYIVEQGTSLEWTYRKWYSGIAECWYKGNITFPSTTTASGVENIYLNYVDVSFPFTFKSNPMATCSVAWGTENGFSAMLELKRSESASLQTQTEQITQLMTYQ